MLVNIHSCTKAETMSNNHLIFSLALYLFGDLRNGLPAIPLTRTDKAGEVTPVPVAEALLQQLLPLLCVILSEGLGVSGGGGNLGCYCVVTCTLHNAT